ncbi:amidase domain-containing protein [Actinosynnema sp. NPDC050436]|uniref:amidase domain-containing protein n=1 Tax=Actinosynnema sp. NPDC050436 TaxID=3155659 RepID=UPI0033C4D5F9
MALGASPALANPDQLAAADRAQLVSLAQRYLQERADRLTTDDVTANHLTSVPVGAAVQGDLAADLAAIDARRDVLRKVNGGHARTEVAVLDTVFTPRGSSVELAFTEHTKLYFARVRPDAPKFEEYGLARHLTFTNTAAGWELTGDVVERGPGDLAPDTDPSAPVTTKGSAPTRSPSAVSRPTDAQLRAAAPGPHVKAGLAGEDVSAQYDYTAMLNYANRYWGPAESNYNGSYRTYGGVGGDCTNFISQIVGSGGWTTVGSWPGDSRSDNSKWFYGDFTWTTSYSWPAAENWYWFAGHESRRTSYVDNVWKMLVTDVLQVDFDRDDNISHSLFVTGRSGSDEFADELFMTYHSNNTHNKPLSSFIASAPDAWYYAHRT